MIKILALVAALAFPACAAAAPAPAAPYCAGPEYRQLDFWVGDWDLAYQGGPSVNHIAKTLDGCVIEENFDGQATGLNGHSLSIYQKATGKWRQTWVDNQGEYIDLIGGMEGDKFVLNTVRLPNAPYYRMVFENIKPASFTWRWQKSSDQGVSYTDSWVIAYTRKK